ncbi:PGAP1-like protein-domain-containing protein [Myxozyma melibiosi]|uniref:GPI inositol-deacylase n=1 Tax=Myxozyma melibiosi TaxID=54550 RepID=A0ABR1FB27_9ASCO
MAKAVVAGSAGEPATYSSLASSRSNAESTSRSTPSPQAKIARPYSAGKHETIWNLCAAGTAVTILALILYSVFNLQLDTKGCRPIFMAPSYTLLKDFNTSHSRLASKYSLYLYREMGYPSPAEVRKSLYSLYHLDGVPVLFIPGNAGSYRQARSIAAEATRVYFDTLNEKGTYGGENSRHLDFFTADFNEDFTAFHGVTLLDQADYLNDAVSYILSLYSANHDSNRQFVPSSVIVLGHSMGGIVARTMLTLPNYREDSMNTIITLSTPHAVVPATFDSEMVKLYEKVNKYWRDSFTKSSSGQNPLSSIALISIAGGKLDDTVPSDYASVSSFLPPTNGFTVFTSSIPNVWTGIDHLAIVWCDQCRKAIAKALLAIVDTKMPGQTKDLETRLHIFRERFLTGLEASAVQQEPPLYDVSLLLSGASISDRLRKGNRAMLRRAEEQSWVFSIPADSQASHLRLLTDGTISSAEDEDQISILLCRAQSQNPQQSQYRVKMSIGEGDDVLPLTCADLQYSTAILPASTIKSKYSYDGPTFSYINHNRTDLSQSEYLVVLDYRSSFKSEEFIFTELANSRAQTYELDPGSLNNFLNGSKLDLETSSGSFHEIKINGASSSLISYKLSLLSDPRCDYSATFSPLLRQFIEDPYESKYFPNVKDKELSFHGLAPFVPVVETQGQDHDLRLNIWLDPTCPSTIQVRVKVDVLGSLGNLVMRYRTALASFPLAIAAVILLIQFRIYNNTGVFVTFGDALYVYLQKYAVFGMIISALLPFVFDRLPHQSALLFKNSGYGEADVIQRNLKEATLYLGSYDLSMSLLGPLFVVISSGLNAGLYYAVLCCLYISSKLVGLIRKKREELLPRPWTSAVIRLLAQSTLVVAYAPYQLAFVISLLVHCWTCIKAFRLRGGPGTLAATNFPKFAISILVLLLWLLPINVPILVVWIHGLPMQWTTPFSSDHNPLYTLPISMMVEILAASRLVPPTGKPFSTVTSCILIFLTVFACIYGMMRAYGLHEIINVLCGWLVLLYFVSDDRRRVGSHTGSHSRKEL